MTIPTHIIAGLIIGKVTGHYEVGVIGATFLDIDHFYSYVRHGSFSSVKKFLHDAFVAHDITKDQRGVFHNVLVFILISVVVLLYNFDIGFTLMVSYASHLILDILDASEYYPLWPSVKCPIVGFIDFSSRQEFLVAVGLLSIYFIL